jgi:hypothetical protein
MDADWYLVIPSNCMVNEAETESLTADLWTQTKKLQVKTKKLEDLKAELEQAREDLAHFKTLQLHWHTAINNAAKPNPTREERRELRGFSEKLGEVKQQAKMQQSTVHRKQTEVGATEKNLNELVKNIATTETRLSAAARISEENKTDNFHVQLPNPVQLQGTWEMALSEISFPRSWNNLDGPKEGQPFGFDTAQNCMELVFRDKTSAKKVTKIKLSIPPGHYEDIKTLLSVMETKSEVHGGTPEETVRVRENFETWVKLKYEPLLNRVGIMVTNKLVCVRLSKHLKYMLGFDERDVSEFQQGTTLAKYAPDFRARVDNLHVFCDIVQPQIVGNMMLPLLRTVPVSGKFGDMVSMIFHSPHYVKVHQRSFSHLHVYISSGSNNKLKFQYGKILVKIHFRKSRLMI